MRDVAALRHFDEKQDPDPYRKVKSLIRIHIKGEKFGSASATLLLEA
jgi:hypothetical protein